MHLQRLSIITNRQEDWEFLWWTGRPEKLASEARAATWKTRNSAGIAVSDAVELLPILAHHT